MDLDNTNDSASDSIIYLFMNGTMGQQRKVRFFDCSFLEEEKQRPSNDKGNPLRYFKIRRNRGCRTTTSRIYIPYASLEEKMHYGSVSCQTSSVLQMLRIWGPSFFVFSLWHSSTTWRILDGPANDKCTEKCCFPIRFFRARTSRTILSTVLLWHEPTQPAAKS